MAHASQHFYHGSPSSSRLAKGRPVPLPLDLDLGASTAGFDSPPHTAERRHEQRNGALSMTPDQAIGGRMGERGEGGEEGDTATRQGRAAGPSRRDVSWSGKKGGQPRSTSASHIDGPTIPTSSRSASSSKLPLSASTASLPRSILGYTSQQRRKASPGRGGGKNEGALPSTSPGQTGVGSSSRFLLTVIPPSHLPHDPPHPRTNPQCSGYGPPEHFKRGILVPLYPTLPSQLAAIAREYGLPSTGGLVLYLLSTADPNSQGPLPGAAGLAGEGGPRISEGAWDLLWSQLLAEEEEMRMLQEGESETEDDDYQAPPVPPLPFSHGKSTAASQPPEENAVLSDDASQSSDAGASGSSVYSSSSKPQQASHSTFGIGRGPPPFASLVSPNGAKRFASLPAHAAHLRQSSRTSFRSTSHSHRPASRSSYALPSHPSFGARATSYGSHSPSLAPPLPNYGASVVVGKVEFDVHATARAGRWYQGWLAGASTGPSTGASSSCAPSATAAAASEPWQELHLPGIVAAKNPQPQRSGFEAQHEDGRYHAYDAPDVRLRSATEQSNGLESAASNFSLAALVAHLPDDPPRDYEDEQGGRAAEEADSSIVDKDAHNYSRSSSSLPSRPVSGASSRGREPSEKDADDTPLMEEQEEAEAEQAYEPLGEDDGEPETQSYQRMDDGSDDGSRYGEEEDENFSQPRRRQEAADPLGDIFPSDEATWRNMATDDSLPRRSERDPLDMTGLGIVGARVAEIEASAAPGIVERVPEKDSWDERGLPPPQDDVAEVVALLGSTPSQQPQGNLASPIRLDSSSAAAESSGVFPPSPARAMSGDDNATSTPFAHTHSIHNSISTVQFSVRPPSTIASMSPEVVPSRKQRQGWTDIPPVVNPSLSASSSLSSIAPLNDKRASTIGLMEDLDDLERALVELSPRAAAQSKASSSPFAIAEGPAGIASAPPPPRTSSATSAPAGPLSSRTPFRYGMLSPPADRAEVAFEHKQEQQDPVSSAVSTADMPGYERDSPREIAAATWPSTFSTFGPASSLPEQPSIARTPSDPVRIPRSSSLSKPETKQPQLVALPPSPLPTSPTPLDEEDQPTPTLPSASPSWPAATSLPPSDTATASQPPRPPRKNTEEEEEEQLAFPAPPPRSPAQGLKGFRAAKWGAKNKAVDIARAASSPELGEENGTKSPIGSFFGKSTFGKAKGFFRRGDSSSPDANTTVPFPAESSLPPPPLSAAAESLFSPLPLSEPEVTPREESLDTPPPSSPTGRQRRPSVSAGSQPPANRPVPPFPASLAATAAASGSTVSPRPAFLAELQPLELHQTAQTSLSSPPVSPSSAAPSCPISASSSLHGAFEDLPPPPPIPGSSSLSQDHLPSPRSDYTPQTPRAGGDTSPFPLGTGQHPASAPATPAEWCTPGGSQMRPRGARKHRLSADIDQLLSQMKDIDFGFEDDKAAGTGEEKMEVLVQGKAEEENVQRAASAASAPVEQIPTSPRIVEPEADVSLAYDGGIVAPLSPDTDIHNPLEKEKAEANAGEQDSNTLRAPGHSRGQDEQGRPFPLSEDLSALGSMMTGLVGSPPTSPDHAPFPYTNYPFPTPTSPSS
ncbi:hypothetical protein JCM11641_007347 [Rhodosporidiobolus odoratus]